jgi:hypothetical protein
MPRSRHHRMASCGNTMVAQQLSPYFLSGFVRADEGGGVRVAKHRGFRLHSAMIGGVPHKDAAVALKLGTLGDETIRVMHIMHGCRLFVALVNKRRLTYLQRREVNERGLPCLSN